MERAIHQQKVVEENHRLKVQLDMRFGLESIVGTRQRMRKIFDMIDAVADTKATVLITAKVVRVSLSWRGHPSAQRPPR